MAVDMFLTLDGVKGESEDKNHPKQIGVLSCSWGMNRSGSAHVGGGPSVGKVNVQDVQVTNSWWHRLAHGQKMTSLNSPEGSIAALRVLRKGWWLIALRRPKRRFRG
jgi:hypothetical protein